MITLSFSIRINVTFSIRINVTFSIRINVNSVLTLSIMVKMATKKKILAYLDVYMTIIHGQKKNVRLI